MMVDAFIYYLLYSIIPHLFETSCKNAKFHAKVHSKTYKNTLTILLCAFASLRYSDYGKRPISSLVVKAFNRLSLNISIFW